MVTAGGVTAGAGAAPVKSTNVIGMDSSAATAGDAANANAAAISGKGMYRRDKGSESQLDARFLA